MRLITVLLLSLFAALPAHANACWEEAGRETNISPALLYAVAKVESSLNPSAKNVSHIARTKSYGIGMMQIESSHLPRLKKEGIDEETLLKDTCTNIKVGGRILADLFARLGVSWDTLGAYNASCTVLKGDDCRRARAIYAWKVYRNLYGGDTMQASAGMRYRAPRPQSRSMRASAPAAPTFVIQGRLS